MMKIVSRLGAIAAGALAMYYLDPQLGQQRRNAFAGLLFGGRRSAAGQPNRFEGGAFHRIPCADPQSDALLRDRVREGLGRMVSHPRAIDVRVDQGVVRLSGDVLLKERDGLLQQVREMPGVQKLVNAMTAHEHPNGIASLEAREEAGEPRGVAA